jgi:hypothetical protein
MKKVVWLAWFVASLGCSSSSAISGPGGDGGGPGPDAVAPFQHDLVVSMQLTVPAGNELHQCQLLALPNDTDVSVVGISHRYTAGSHHFLVFATDLDTIPTDLEGQYDCTRGDESIMAHTRGVLYAAQSPNGEGKFPPGVGFGLKAHQVLMLQTHYLNTTPRDLENEASVGFDVAPPGSISIQAGFLVFYDPFIYLPPQGMASAGMRCGVPNDINFLAGSTHYHQRGQGMRVWLDPSPAMPSSAPLFETHDWEHAPNLIGPIPIAAGSSIRVQCDYSNSDVAEVFQGPNAATSEMCVFAGLYYPKLDGGFEDCYQASFAGTGTHTCSEQLTCIQACPAGDAPQFAPGGVIVGPCWEKCIAMGCDGGTDALLALTTCVGDQCQAECQAGTCDACAVAKCGPNVNACFGHACP